MVRDNRITERIFAIFLLGALLLLPPVLLVFNMPTRVLGVPVLFLYIFLVWAVLIALATAIARWLESEDRAPGQDDVAKEGGAPSTVERVHDA